jgi:hypothetical protein
VTLLVLALAPTFARTAAAEATTFTESFAIPITTGFISCEGEVVFLTGEVHILTHGTFDPAGGVHSVTRANFSDVHGVGTESGALYIATDSSMEIFNGKLEAAREDTFERSFLLVAQGDLSNAQVHAIGHLTTNANGEVTVDFIRVNVGCQL